MVQEVTIKRKFEARLRHKATGKLCHPSSKWVPFSNKGRIRQRKERDGLRLHQLCPRYSGTLTSTAPTAIRLWETFTYLYHSWYPFLYGALFERLPESVLFQRFCMCHFLKT